MSVVINQSGSDKKLLKTEEDTNEYDPEARPPVKQFYLDHQVLYNNFLILII